MTKKSFVHVRWVVLVIHCRESQVQCAVDAVERLFAEQKLSTGVLPKPPGDTDVALVKKLKMVERVTLFALLPYNDKY